MDRRDVLRGLAIGAAAPIAGSIVPAEWISWGREIHAAVAREQTPPSLGPEVLRTLGAACDRIIPADVTPGAIAAGTPSFIDRMLSDWYDAPERIRVIAGLESLDGTARARHSRSFVECTVSEQDAMLLELDREGASHWFGTVKYLTIWGYYTSEIGVVEELGQGRPPGRYDGCAPYAPRQRNA